jgi:hypothetical protein
VNLYNSEQPTVTRADNSLNSARKLPYTKPLIDDVAEFYTVGHDTPGSMYDPLIFHCASVSETLAFLYAGIGDAPCFPDHHLNPSYGRDVDEENGQEESQLPLHTERCETRSTGEGSDLLLVAGAIVFGTSSGYRYQRLPDGPGIS